jgi:hypothetical protein
MSDLVDKYSWVFLNGFLKALSAEDIGKKGVIDDKIELFCVTSLHFPFLPFFIILIYAFFQLLQRCLPPCLELLSIEEPIPLDTHPRIEHIRVAASLQIFSNFTQSPFGIFVKTREVNRDQLFEHMRKFFLLF